MRLVSIIGNKYIAIKNYTPCTKTFNVLVSFYYNVLNTKPSEVNNAF